MRLARSLAAVAVAAACSLSLAAPAMAAPVAKKHVITFVATSNGVATVVAAGNGVATQNERTGKWTHTYKATRVGHYYLSVSTRSGDGGATSVRCTIKVDGKVKKTKSATGDYASASCQI